MATERDTIRRCRTYLWLLLSVVIVDVECQVPQSDLENLGCWKDSESRAIPTLEGKDSRLDGPYQSRVDAVRKCKEAAMARGYTVFAVQNGGWCASSSNAENTYTKYGQSDDCQEDGEGGSWANQVYRISPLGTSTTLCPEDNESSITPPTVSLSTSVAQPTTENSHITSVDSLPRADSCTLNATRSRRGTLLHLNYGSRVLFVCPKGTRIVDSFISICNHGNRMIPYRRCADVDECENDQHNCSFNFKCHNTIGSYLCLCSDGYRQEGGLCVPKRTLSARDGNDNEISENDNNVENNYCSESDDGLWERTEPNHFTSWIPCSDNRAGVMRRFCDVDGEWNDPDITECKTKELLDIAEKITKARDVSDAVGIILSVAHSQESHNAISTGDMVLISEMLAKLAATVVSFKESSLNDTEMYIKLFSGELCQLLTKDREPVWKEIRERLAPDKGVVTLFAALDSIGTTIYNFMIRSGLEFASSCSALEINGIFFKEKENLVVGQSQRDGSTRQRRLVQWNRTVTQNSYVYLTKNTLDKLRAATSEDKPLAVVSYIYINPGDIIPADALSTRSHGQEWVSSITAVNRIKKVNTPVVSVSVFPKPVDNMKLEIQMRFFEKEEGYSPVCSFMKLEAEHGMWSTSGCKVTHSGKLDTLDYVECACSHLGSFAVIMTMGQSPKPFLEAAAVPILTLCCSLSLLFIVISLFAVFMARLTSDFYVVLAQAILSFSFFPIVVAMDSLFDKQEYEKYNSLVMAFSHTALLSNSFWMMNLSVQFFICLKYYLYRCTRARVLYVICGWVIPCVVLACLIWMLPTDKEKNSPSLDSSAILSSIDVMVLLISSVAILVFCYDYRMLAELVKLLRGPEEEILSAKMESAMLLHAMFIVTRIVNFAVHLIENPVISMYAFACCIFMEGSVIYLGFFATNKELLIVLRARYFAEDEEHKQAVKDFEDEDCQRLQIQKEMMENKKKHGKRNNPESGQSENAEVQSRKGRLQYRNTDENSDVNMPSENIVLEEIK
ncbi:adhesion G protein-coupled receptor L4-like [Ptychodera flava]|uniref:adhesion G protein-coupled receptor L4-like n=1 Tax=Ptychodera flava TaxID=63121 RepID=UPI00396A9F83